MSPDSPPRGAVIDAAEVRAKPSDAQSSAVLLPDPEPRPRTLPIISVDDHLIEPRDLFEGRLPDKLADRAPKVSELDNGTEFWEFDGKMFANVGLNAVAGRPRDQWSMEPARFDEMRPGCYDIDARIRDMDLAGIWASLCFPSLIAGFAGTVFSRCSDPELGLACVRAWNDWHAEVWAGTHPGRIIPLQIPWLGDPLEAAAEVRRNAERGFKAISFPEFPTKVGCPGLRRGAWDPLFEACEETSTVVCLHTGSAAWAPISADDLTFEAYPTLFPVTAYLAATEWLWSGVPVRFPNLRIAFSEGGIGWVPMFYDRVDYVLDHSASGRESRSWKSDLRPSEVAARSFWFCTIDDPSVIALRDRIGVSHICLESDYPHADSTWPDTQTSAARMLAGLPADQVQAICGANAARLFDHPLPPPEWLGGADA